MLSDRASNFTLTLILHRKIPTSISSGLTISELNSTGNHHLQVEDIPYYSGFVSTHPYNSEVTGTLYNNKSFRGTIERASETFHVEGMGQMNTSCLTYSALFTASDIDWSFFRGGGRSEPNLHDSPKFADSDGYELPQAASFGESSCRTR